MLARVGAHILVHPRAERGNVALFDRKARGELVSAEAHKKVGARFERIEEVKAAVAAARALTRPAGEVDHKARAGEFFGKSRRHNAHDALMPVLAGQHERTALALGKVLHLLDGAAENVLLHALALAVELAQLARELFRADGIVGEQQFRGQLGAAHAARGVDARGEHKADLNRRDGARREPRLAQQRVQPRKVAAVDALKPALHDGAVLALHAHDVGDRADGGKRAVARKQRILAPLAKGQNELERDAHTRQVLEGIRAVGPVGVNDGHGGGELLLALVVVGDDKIDAERRGVGRLVHARDAAVDRDDQRHAGLGKCADGVTAEAVALLDAAGDVHRHIRPARAEIIGQKAGRGDTVHVVVAEDRQLFAVFKRLRDARDGLVHVLHQKRGVSERLLALERFGGLLARGDAARGQHRRDKIGVSRVHQRLDGILWRGGDLPVLVLHVSAHLLSFENFWTYYLRQYCLIILIQSIILTKTTAKVKRKFDYQ